MPHTTAQTMLGLLLSLVTAVSAPAGETRTADEAAIRDVQQQQQDAWNRHDAHAYAALFAEDGDVVNVVGWWWKGRAEIESKLAAAYVVVFRDSTLKVEDVTVRFLEPDIAVAHVRWSMTGARTPTGIPEPRRGIQTQVLQRRDGRWQIAAFQNTNSAPEVPFTTAPATPPSQ